MPTYYYWHPQIFRPSDGPDTKGIKFYDHRWFVLGKKKFLLVKKNFFSQSKLSVIPSFNLVIKDCQKSLDIDAIFNHNEVEEISLIFDKWPQSRPNQTSYRKLYFTEFCSKFLKVYHGLNFFWPPTSRRQLEAKNCMKESIYCKKSF